MGSNLQIYWLHHKLQWSNAGLLEQGSHPLSAMKLGRFIPAGDSAVIFTSAGHLSFIYPKPGTAQLIEGWGSHTLHYQYHLTQTWSGHSLFISVGPIETVTPLPRHPIKWHEARRITAFGGKDTSLRGTGLTSRLISTQFISHKPPKHVLKATIPLFLTWPRFKPTNDSKLHTANPLCSALVTPWLGYCFHFGVLHLEKHVDKLKSVQRRVTNMRKWLEFTACEESL